MEKSCKTCCSTTFEESECSYQAVCTSCGTVFDHGNDSSQLIADESLISGSSSSYNRDTDFYGMSTNYTKRYGEKITNSKKLRNRGSVPIDEWCSTLKLNDATIERSWALFEQVNEHEDNYHAHLKTKSKIGLICVYFACCEVNYPTSLLELSNISGYSLPEVNEAYTKVKTILNIPSSHLDISAFVEPLCAKLKLGDQIKETALHIIEICKNVSLTSGCYKDKVVLAAVYLSWQASDPIKNSKVNLQNFALKFKIGIPKKHFSTSQEMKRLKEIREVLTKLSEEIPWLVDQVSDKSLPFHLNDIIDFRKSALKEHAAKIRKRKYSENADTDRRLKVEGDSDNKGEEESTEIFDPGDWFKRRKFNQSTTLDK